MIDVTDINNLLKAAVPRLTLAPTYVVQKTPTPYAIYVTEFTPIRTQDGIVGWQGIYDITVFESTKAKVDALMAEVVDALDGVDTADETSISLESSDYTFYFEDGLHAITLKFKLLQ